jgi:rhodanese-related sulfurtransferase
MTDEGAAEVELSPERASELIAELELIDVRRAVEWRGARIAGARNIEVNELAAAADSIPRDRPVLFYCRTGSRSAMAAEAFRLAGYDARSLTGGIEAWAAAGQPLEPEDGDVRAPPPPSS